MHPKKSLKTMTEADWWLVHNVGQATGRDQIVEAIKCEPLQRLKSNTYDAQLVEAVRQDILQLIAKLDTILKNVA
jgi:hypothetical protein